MQLSSSFEISRISKPKQRIGIHAYSFQGEAFISKRPVFPRTSCLYMLIEISEDLIIYLSWQNTRALECLFRGILMWIFLTTHSESLLFSSSQIRYYNTCAKLSFRLLLLLPPDAFFPRTYLLYMPSYVIVRRSLLFIELINRPLHL